MGGENPVQIVDIEAPRPGPSEVLIKIENCGICGTDVHMTDGEGLNFSVGRHFGHEYAGVIEAVGSGVTHLRIGDRVTAMPQMGCGKCSACLAGEPYWCAGERPARHGGFANYTVATEQSTVKVPDGVPLATAALTEPLACGLHGIGRSGMRRGDKVLCFGAGPIGLSAVYWAKKLGAGRVAAYARSDRAARLALAIGADSFTCAGQPHADDFSGQLDGAPDIVLECTGAAGMIEASVKAVKPRGAVVVLGYRADKDSFVPSRAVDKEVDLRFAIVYNRRDFEHCLAAMAEPDFAPAQMITGTVPLAALPETLGELRRPSSHCKVMVSPWAD